MSLDAGRMSPENLESTLLEVIESLPGSADEIIESHRRRAISSVVACGFPSRRNEDWKYTDPSPMYAALGERMWDLPTAPGLFDLSLFDAAASAVPEAYRLVVVDGRYREELSQLPEGVQVRSLGDLLNNAPELALEILSVDEREPLFNGFTALNSAMAVDGIDLSISDGCCVDRPIHLLHLSSSAGTVAHVRNRIFFGRGAKATVIEHFAGQPGQAGMTNVVTNIRIGQNASLTHYRVQEEHDRHFHIGRADVVQQKGSRYFSHVATLGAALSRTDVLIRLDEPAAECTLNGIYLLSQHQHADHHTRIDHVAPHSTSREYYRGVLDGEAHAVFNGKVVVHQGAEKTDAAQSNGNLLLSSDAEVDTKPELEIYADDVKCSHGATVGQIDAEALFYLRSRGMAESAARNLLTYAFADDVIRKMDLAPLRERLERAILDRLPGEGVRAVEA